MRYNNMRSKEISRWTLLPKKKYKNQNEAINDLNEVKKIIDVLIGDLGSQSSLNK